MSKLPQEVIIKLEEMKKPAELWSVQLLRKNLQAHLTARENAERQRRAHLPQNVVNKVIGSPPKRSSAEALMVGTNQRLITYKLGNLPPKSVFTARGIIGVMSTPGIRLSGKERKE